MEHLKAFVHKKLATNLPLFYIGLANDLASGETILRARTDLLAGQLEASTLKVSGVSSEEKLPDDRLTAMPPVPIFEALVYDQEEKILKVAEQRSDREPTYNKTVLMGAVRWIGTETRPRPAPQVKSP